jgi:hypothetical protein
LRTVRTKAQNPISKITEAKMARVISTDRVLTYLAKSPVVKTQHCKEN